MSETNQASDPYQRYDQDLQFGEEIAMTQCGYAFQPILGLEMEVDETVYMYSDDGNLEICLLGGTLEDNASIAEINDSLAAEVLGKVDRFELIEAGTDSIQGVRGFLNEIYYADAGEDGTGRALICSPHLNQYFFMLVIASFDFWEEHGQTIFEALKSRIHFHPQFITEEAQKQETYHADLTLETYESLQPDEDFLLNIEKGELSFLLAARAHTDEDVVSITRIIASDGKTLYDFDPQKGAFKSLISDRPLIGSFGEVCFFFPVDSQNNLLPGTYCFSFDTQSKSGLQEIRGILRDGRALGLQALDFNLWLAVDDERFYDQDGLDQLEKGLFNHLQQKMIPFNLTPGKITFIHPAMDELEAFSSINTWADVADCSYMISENVDNNRALNLGLVAQIGDGILEAKQGGKAISSASPGMIMSTTSPHTCILLDWNHFKDDLNGLTEAILDQLIRFSGIDVRGIQGQEGEKLTLNQEIAWRIRRHPLFYDAG